MSSATAAAVNDTAAAPPARPGIRRGKKKRGKVRLGERLTLAVLVALFAYLVLPPLVFMLWTSITPTTEAGASQGLSLSAYASILLNSDFPTLLSNTLVFSAGSTVGAMSLGLTMSWLVARTDVLGKSLAYVITFLGFAVPGLLKVIGWMLLLGPQNGAINNFLKFALGSWATLSIESMGGMIFVESLLWVPTVFLLTVGPFRAMDPSLEESAAVSGAGPLRTQAKITAPLLLPSMLSVLVLMFIKSVQSFEVPLFLGTPGGIKVLTSEIYLDLREAFIPDYAAAAAFGTLLVTFLFGILIFYYHVTRQASRFQTVTGKGYRPRLIRLGSMRWVASAFLIVLFLLYCFPIFYIVLVSFLRNISDLDGQFWHHFTIANYLDLRNYPGIWRSVLDSLFVGIVTATAVVVLATVAAWVMVRTRIESRWILDQMISLPLIIPGIVLGLAVLLFYLYVPIPLYGTLWILVAAYTTAYTTYGLRYTQPALLQIHTELEESARMSGAGWPLVFRRILLPLLMPAVLGAWVYVFFQSFRELSIAALLYTSDTSVVSTQLLDLWVNGNPAILAAFGSVVTLTSVSVAGIAFRFGSRLGVKL